MGRKRMVFEEGFSEIIEDKQSFEMADLLVKMDSKGCIFSK
jgi:hypothetical protein